MDLFLEQVFPVSPSGYLNTFLKCVEALINLWQQIQFFLMIQV